jgi:glycosyltransferase involved in cell wall biosynthesis
MIVISQNNIPVKPDFKKEAINLSKVLLKFQTSLFLMLMRRKKIFWLCSWYPNRIDPFDGDFIQRHAKTASLSNDIYVVRIVADEKGVVSNKVITEIKKEGSLTECICYFKKSSSWFGKIIAARKWFQLFKKAIENYFEKNGKPDLVHVHVPMKAGLLALWMKRKFGLPYLVSEHLGIYNEIDERKYSDRSILYKKITRKIFVKASKFLTVSKYLGEGVNNLISKKQFKVIPNVVNTDFFFFKENLSDKFRFIHVSNMVPLKNVKGILDAAAILSKSNNNFEMVMIGNRDDSMKDYATEIGLSNVFFKNEILYEEVAKEMQQSHAFILFSNIENSPCVISEALCCGLPVIAGKVGGIPELINNENGVLISPKNTDELASAMNEIMLNYQLYNRQKIAAAAKEKFNYSVVDKMFDEAYSEVLNKGN